MSDQGLRDALERLAKSWFRLDCRVDLPENAQWGEGVAQGYANAAADLLRTVREHPAEPVGVSDEAVAITDEMRKESQDVKDHLKEKLGKEAADASGR